MKRAYTPPPDPVYKLGRKKAKVTIAIKSLEAVQGNLSVFQYPNLLGLSQGITELLPLLRSYRKSLDQ